MYFSNRSQAGAILAEQLATTYFNENCAVVAVSESAVLVAEQIASTLNCVLTLLLAENIDIPGESITLGAVSQEGGFTFNSSLTESQINGYVSEFHGYLEEQKRVQFQKMNRLVGDGGIMDLDLLRDRVIILVSDGIASGTGFDVAIDYMKPISIQKLIIAAPTASISAVDKIHVIADELHVLDVKENFVGVDHYYEDNTLPQREEIIQYVRDIVSASS